MAIKLIPTADDWHPSYQIDGQSFARVELLKLRNGWHKILVCGADDFGLERVVPGYESAVMIFDAMREASIERLEAQGYVPS